MLECFNTSLIECFHVIRIITLSGPNSVSTLPSLLAPVPCSVFWHGTTGVMMMMVVVPLLFSSSYSWRFWQIHGSCRVIDNQFTPITLCASNIPVASGHQFIQCFLSPKRRVIWGFSLVSSCCWLMVQVFPGLTVVTVESSSTFRTWWVKWRYRVAVWGSTMAVVFSAAVPAQSTKRTSWCP
jgi:hypothetical protein